MLVNKTVKIDGVWQTIQVEMEMPNPRISEIQQELQDIQAWFTESDWKAHKIALGEWERTSDKAVAYLEERALKRELQDSLTNELSLLEV